MNFDLNECKNEIKDNYEKSCSWFRNRVYHEIDAASVGVKITLSHSPCKVSKILVESLDISLAYKDTNYFLVFAFLLSSTKPDFIFVFSDLRFASLKKNGELRMNF